jgi:4-hydroxybenzoate polyprenyltransferase
MPEFGFMQRILPSNDSRFWLYWRLARFDKPIGTFLVLWPTLWALWLAAEGKPSWPILLVFVLGAITMRAAGCVINDVADRDIDGRVERTHQRPLATGLIEVKQALLFFVGLCSIALLLVLQLNMQTIFWSFGALARDDLPFHETFYFSTSSFFGCGLRLVDSDGLCSGDRIRA